jgi:hypothetical protein
MPHAIFAPSDTKTWINCSWSALNAVPEPPKPESTVSAAQAGTEKHAVMEAGGIPEVEAFLAQLERGDVFRELRVTLTDECWGTADVLNDAACITILDGKFGKWDVPAVENFQLLTYAAAWLPRTDADWWRLVIYQPHGLDEEPWKQWIAHRSQVEAHRQRVLRAIADRSAPKPGPWCRWCKAFQHCPAMSTDAGFVMGAMSRPPEQLTHDELVRLLRIIRALGDVKPVYEDALLTHQKLGHGDPPKLGRSFRAWNDDLQAAELLHREYGAKGVKPVSPAQAEKLGLVGKQYAIAGAHKPEAPYKANY